MLKQTMIAFVGVVAVGAGFAQNVEAADFGFSFTAQGNFDVEGVIRGLGDDGTFAASSVEVTSNTGGFGGV